MDKQETLIPMDEVQQIVKKKKDGRDGRNLPTSDFLAGTEIGRASCRERV